MIRPAPIALVVLALLASACASTPSAEPADPAVQQTTRRSPNVISEEELTASTARNALEAVQRLRPEWLRGRGGAGMSDVRELNPADLVVYVGNSRYGGMQSLSQFPLTTIKSLRYYNASEATNRWGTNHSGGAIVVTSR